MAKYKYLDYAGLETLVGKIKDQFTAMDQKHAVVVNPILKSGVKIAEITVGGTKKELFSTPDTTYTFASGEGCFTVTPVNGTAQTVNVGKPTNAGHADTAGHANTAGTAESASKLSVVDKGNATTPVYFKDGVPVVCDTFAKQKDFSDLSTKVDNLVETADALVFKGDASDIKSGGTFNAGYTYKVSSAGTYAGHLCEVGDLIICVKEGASATTAGDWMVVQNNVDLVGSKDTIGLVKNGSTVTSATGYVATPIIGGVPYYKDYSGDITSAVSNALDALDNTITANVDHTHNDDRVITGDIAFLISVSQVDGLLSAGTCATMKRITEQEIGDMWGEPIASEE